MGMSTTKTSTSKFLALTLSPKRRTSWIIPVGLTSCPPKPRMGWTKGIISLPGFLQVIPGDDVHRTPGVDKNPSHDGAGHLHFNYQWIIVWRGKVLAFFSSEHHGRYCNSASLLGREDLLGFSKLYLPGIASDVFCISTGNSGYYFSGAFFVLRFRPHGLAFFLKEACPFLQKAVNLSLIG